VTIEEMQKERAALEARLRNVAAEIVEEFQNRTRLQVTGVHVDLAEDRALGRPARSIVTGAHLVVEL
jgi:hypothetical protein